MLFFNYKAHIQFIPDFNFNFGLNLIMRGGQNTSGDYQIKHISIIFSHTPSIHHFPILGKMEQDSKPPYKFFFSKHTFSSCPLDMKPFSWHM